MRIDVNAFVGAYPYRRVPNTTPEALLSAMARIGVDEAWVSHLPGMFWRDPHEGNAWLYDLAGRHTALRPVPAVHPGLRHWDAVVTEARSRGAPAVRADPMMYGLDPSGTAMRRLGQVCGEAGVPLVLAVRLEDGRQRHPNDRAAELPPSAVRALVRSDARLRLLVTHADRPFVEEVHFGSTPEEAARLSWDICWIWGPPEEHLATLLATMGADRFVLGTGQPLRLPEAAVAKLDLIELPAEQRIAIEAGNAQALAC